MPVSRDRLAQIISGKAARMCSPSSQRKFDEMAGQVRGSINEDGSYNDGGASLMGDQQLAQYDAMFSYGSSDDSQVRDIDYTQTDAKNSKMPEAIKASMLNERIDTSSFGGISVLDSLGVKGNNASMQQKRAQINEQQYTAAPQQTVGGVDYSIIKAIVNECLSNYFSKNQINESTGVLEGIRLQGGNIRLVDNKGNVYEAKLKKVKDNNE